MRRGLGGVGPIAAGLPGGQTKFPAATGDLANPEVRETFTVLPAQGSQS